MKSLSRQATILIMSLAMAPAAGVMAQDISSIAKSDPLIITGAIGTHNTFYTSSFGTGNASPLSNSLYARLNLNLYGISMPFSFYYHNDNTSFGYPAISFHFRPTYKNWTLHIGESSMPFSSYIYNIPFTGVGIEYQARQGHNLRFGAFYGELREAINYEPDEISLRRPQYRRTGWGMKVGYGSSRNYIDLYVFKAKDHLSSIDECWHDQIYAQENLVGGTKLRLSLGRHLSLQANYAASLLSNDVRGQLVDVEAVKRYDDIFDVRYTSIFRWAGDARLQGHWRHFNFLLSYKLVQPDYQSMGLHYVSSNYQSLSMATSATIGKLSVNANIAAQSNNLNGKQLYTTRGLIYSASASLPIGDSFSLTATYNGYRQRQYDGAAQVVDSTRVDRTTSSWSVMPCYQFETDATMQYVNLSANRTTNRDLNPWAQGLSDVSTLAMGAGYNVMVNAIETNFGADVSYQQSEGFGTEYRTVLYSLMAGRSFLKEKNLSTSASVTLTHNKVSQQVSDLSLGGAASASYTLHKVHSFNLTMSCNRYTSINFVSEPTQNYHDYRCTLGYNYTFTALHIKRRAEKGAKREIESDFYSANRRQIREQERRNQQQRAQQQAQQDAARRQGRQQHAARH